MKMWEIIDRGRGSRYDEYEDKYSDIRKMIKEAYECGLEDSYNTSSERQYPESRYSERRYNR